MKKKIITSIAIFLLIIVINIISAKADTSRVLYIYDNASVNGDNIKRIIEDVSNNDISVTLKPIGTNKSFSQVASSISNESFTDIIIQDSYSHVINNSLDIVSGINVLRSKLSDETYYRSYISTPWKNLTSSEKIEVSKRISDIENQSEGTIGGYEIYDNLLEAKDKSINVINGDRLTTSGELLIACSYYRKLTGNGLENLTSYAGISDKDVSSIVDIVNNEENEIITSSSDDLLSLDAGMVSNVSTRKKTTKKITTKKKTTKKKTIRRTTRKTVKRTTKKTKKKTTKKKTVRKTTRKTVKRTTKKKMKKTTKKKKTKKKTTRKMAKRTTPKKTKKKTTKKKAVRKTTRRTTYRISKKANKSKTNTDLYPKVRDVIKNWNFEVESPIRIKKNKEVIDRILWIDAPTGLKDPKFSWESSDPSTVKIIFVEGKNGERARIIGLKEGKARIIVTGVYEGIEKKREIDVIVTK